MKTILSQLGQGILKYKKKLIYGILALFIGQIFFFNLGGVGISNVVYADDNTPSQSSDFQKKATEWFQSVQYFQKLIYLLIYPILILAGKLVDNSLVYGEVFYFDAVLWQLWNIMRNFANFGLGFIFIFKIFQFLIKGQKGADIKKLLTSALIAGVGIQASWFIMAALIDVSTILTYGVGGLPLSTLKNFEGEDEIKYNSYHVPSVIYADTEEHENYHLYLSNLPLLGTGEKGNAKFISQCKTFTYVDASDEYEITKAEIILSPDIVYYKSDDGTWYSTEANVCHMGEDIYYFRNLYEGIKRPSSASGTGWSTAQSEYEETCKESITKLQSEDFDYIQGLINNETLLLIGNAHDVVLDGLFNQFITDDSLGLDVGNEKTGNDWGLPRLNDIIDGGGYAGVFASLYGSLLNAGINLRFSSTTDNGIYVSLLNVILSFLHMLAIAIPLIVMMVVFLLRIGVLWMAIVLSPIIVLLKAFGFEKDVEKKIDLWKYITVENLIPIIFSPVVVCFAISMSTVLVRIISAMNRTNVDTGKQDILGGIISLDIAGLGVNVGKLVCSVICIAITWFLVWAAVKSSKLGESGLVKGIENLTNTTLGSIPIVPVPTKDGLTFVGKDAAFGGNDQQGIFSKISNDIQSEYSKKSSDVAEDLLHPERALVRQADAYKSELIRQKPSSDWTQMLVTIPGKNGNNIQKKFADIYDPKKEDIINAINGISDDGVRDEFGRVTPTVTFNKNGKDVTYVYGEMEIDGKKKKGYKKQ